MDDLLTKIALAKILKQGGTLGDSDLEELEDSFAPYDYDVNERKRLTKTLDSCRKDCTRWRRKHDKK